MTHNPRPPASKFCNKTLTEVLYMQQVYTAAYAECAEHFGGEYGRIRSDKKKRNNHAKGSSAGADSGSGGCFFCLAQSTSIRRFWRRALRGSFPTESS